MEIFQAVKRPQNTPSGGDERRAICAARSLGWRRSRCERRCPPVGRAACCSPPGGAGPRGPHPPPVLTKRQKQKQPFFSLQEIQPPGCAVLSPLARGGFGHLVPSERTLPWSHSFFSRRCPAAHGEVDEERGTSGRRRLRACQRVPVAAERGPGDPRNLRLQGHQRAGEGGGGVGPERPG